VLGKEIKDILSKKASKPNRFARMAYQELKDSNSEIKKQLRKAKKSGDRKKMLELIDKLEIGAEDELRNEIKGTVEFTFRNTKVSVKRSYLEKLKDPEKYVNKLYLNKTLNQIKRLEAKGKETEASGLIELAWKTNDKIRTDKAKQKSFKAKLRRLNKKVKGKNVKEFNIRRDKEGNEIETEYSIIYSTSGSVIDVTVI